MADFKLQSLAKTYFEMETEIELYKNNRRCVQEIDVLANLDGQLVIGEAKTNGRLNGTQLAAYVNLCKQVNPVIFAVVSSTTISFGAKTSIEVVFAGMPNPPKLIFISP